MGPDRSASRDPAFGQRRDLKLVGRGARALIGQEGDCVGDLARVRQRRGVHTLAPAALEGLDAGVHDEQGDVDALLAQLERGRLRDGPDGERARGPQSRPGIARRAEPPVTWISVAGRDCSTAKRAGRREEGEGRAPGRRRPVVERGGSGLRQRTAAEGAAARAAVRRRGVDDEVDGAVGLGRLGQAPRGCCRGR